MEFDCELVLFVRRLKTSDAIIYCPKCNISNVKSLAAALDYLKFYLPPIKGHIQAAMGLRVKLNCCIRKVRLDKNKMLREIS